MAEFKLVISEQEKSIARTVGDPQSAGFLGKRIGESVGGELLGAGGYTFRITGGTDKSGFPLRPDLPGARQTRLYVGDGFGFNAPRRGMRRRTDVPRQHHQRGDGPDQSRRRPERT